MSDHASPSGDNHRNSFTGVQASIIARQRAHIAESCAGNLLGTLYIASREEPVACTFTYSDESVFRVAIDADEANEIQVGNLCTAYSTLNDVDEILTAHVAAITEAGARRLFIEFPLPGSQKSTQFRRHDRLAITDKDFVHLLIPGSRLKGRITDLSPGGCRVEFAEPLPSLELGKTSLFTLEVEGKTTVIPSQVRWKRDPEFGLAFELGSGEAGIEIQSRIEDVIAKVVKHEASLLAA